MTKPKVNRKRPGATWRLLVHEMIGKQSSGTSYDIFSHQEDADHALATQRKLEASAEAQGRTYPDYSVRQVLPDTEFDELVVGRWLHVEQMSDTDYWMDIGGLVVNVTCRPDGTPKVVRWELDNRQDKCTYYDGSEDA